MPDDDLTHESVKQRYRFDQWGGVSVESTRPVLEFAPDLRAEHPGLMLEYRMPLPDDGRSFSDHYVDAGDRSVRFLVSIHRYGSAEAAREALVDELENTMAVKLPACSERGIRAGEVCFCDFSELVSHIVFVRRNIFVRIDSIGDTPAPAAALAATVDRQIAASRD
jgi:hypothetical protein